jgi:hypothetical protein
MDIITYTHPVPFCLIKNFCCSEKVEQIKNELNTLRPFLLSASDTNPAKTNAGDLAVKRKGIFLHEHTYLQGNSGINSIFDTVISKPIVEHLVQKNWVFSYLKNKYRLGTLISLYEDGDTYKYHQDRSTMSIIYYLFDGEFEGGDFYIRNVKIPIENNSLIIFPSCVDHCVQPMTGPGSRWSITTFFNIAEELPKSPPDVIKVKNFTSPEEWNTIQTNMPMAPWILQGNSTLGEDNDKFWYTDLSHNEFFTCTLFERIPNGPWILERVYANGQTFGQNGKFHQDSTNPRCWTFLLYTNPIEPNIINEWGGQTEFETNDGRLSQIPEPNLGILFKSDIFHRGFGPSKKVSGLRITIAWKLIKA